MVFLTVESCKLFFNKAGPYCPVLKGNPYGLTRSEDKSCVRTKFSLIPTIVLFFGIVEEIPLRYKKIRTTRLSEDLSLPWSESLGKGGQEFPLNNYIFAASAESKRLSRRTLL